MGSLCALLMSIQFCFFIFSFRRRLKWLRPQDLTRQQTAELIKEAQAEYEGLYSFLYSSTCLYQLFSDLTQVHFLSTLLTIFLLSTLPPDLKLHNLLSLAAKHLKISPSSETSGYNLFLQHQKPILKHFGHKNTAVLPEDIIQRLLLGVSILIVPFSAIHS